MLPTRDPPQKKRLTQPENEELEKIIPSKWTAKKEKSWCSNTYIRKNKFQNKSHEKGY